VSIAVVLELDRVSKTILDLARKQVLPVPVEVDGLQEAIAVLVGSDQPGRRSTRCHIEVVAKTGCGRHPEPFSRSGLHWNAVQHVAFGGAQLVQRSIGRLWHRDALDAKRKGAAPARDVDGNSLPD